MKLVRALSFIILTGQIACKDNNIEYKISGRILDGTTKIGYQQVSFDVYSSDRNGNASQLIGNFKTNDSGDFLFTYKKSKGFGLMFLNSNMKFKNIAINKSIHQNYYKSTLGKYRIFCDCPNLKTSDTLFLEFPKMVGNEIIRGIDTLANIKSGDTFTYSIWPIEEFSLAWGVNAQQFSWEMYQNHILIKKYQGRLRGSVTGDPVINEFIIKY